MKPVTASDAAWMRRALRLARRAHGQTSPNPLVGAVLVRRGRIIGQGWHRRAGEPHAEIEALRDAERRVGSAKGATLYVTLEPCCTRGRTPPCTDALIAAGLRRVVAGATDPNPRHSGRGFDLLRAAGLEVRSEVLAPEATRLNEAFNHWIRARTPFVTLKAGLTLDGKIATARGESKWITSEAARTDAQRLRHGADAVLVGIHTILADDPSLTIRPLPSQIRNSASRPPLRRIILDSQARTPLAARAVADEYARWTTVVVSRAAPARRVTALRQQVPVLVAPTRRGRLDLRWLLRQLGSENVTSLLVEGGGEVHASFLEQGLAQRVVLYYAPKILGGRDARKAVAGSGARGWPAIARLREVQWRQLGPDLRLSARIDPAAVQG